MSGCWLYPAKASLPIDVSRNELLNKPTEYEFLAIQGTCKPPTPRVPFTWDNILSFASKPQARRFNDFRKKYVRSIVDDYCRANGCVPIGVGTTDPSPSSDIDFDMYSSGNREINEIIRDIHAFHESRFARSLDEVFDVNLYGTISDVFVDAQCAFGACERLPKPSIEAQHAWAFARAAEAISANAPETAAAMLSERDRSLYETCLRRRERRSNDRYLSLLGEFLKLSKRRTSVAKLAEAFSEAKYHENETYRSVGATLHIVRKQPKLDPSMWIDSVYDNFGFFAETVFASVACAKREKARVSRACKYLARICDARMNLPNAAPSISRMREICARIDADRKRMKTPSALDLRALRTELGLKTADFDAAPRFLEAVYVSCVKL